jgi:AmmeMemoRadiSam system protein B
MSIRRPIAAHQFYPGRPADCRALIEQCLQEAPLLPASLPAAIVAGIAPHAGWIFSGALAASVFAAVKRQQESVDVCVILGASHSYFGTKPAVSDDTAWETPLGSIEVCRELVDQLVKAEVAGLSNMAHRAEHSIEVQVPFVQYCFPTARLCPVVVPPTRSAVSLGEWLGRWMEQQKGTVLCLGSTDLTHYGPGYGFVPKGRGREGIEWAAQVNDRRFIELALALEPQRMLSEAAENVNACGPGAAAAAVAAAKVLGRTTGHLLGYTNSHRVMADKMATSSLDSVGYAAMVF